MAPPLSSPRVRTGCSAVRCWISVRTVSAGVPPSRLPSPSAVRPAYPSGRAASRAVRAAALRGRSRSAMGPLSLRRRNTPPGPVHPFCPTRADFGVYRSGRAPRHTLESDSQSVRRGRHGAGNGLFQGGYTMSSTHQQFDIRAALNGSAELETNDELETGDAAVPGDEPEAGEELDAVDEAEAGEELDAVDEAKAG